MTNVKVVEGIQVDGESVVQMKRSEYERLISASPQPIYDETRDRQLFEDSMIEASEEAGFGEPDLYRDSSGCYRQAYHQAAWGGWLACAQSRDKADKELYTHADAGEFGDVATSVAVAEGNVRLLVRERDTLRAQLAGRDTEIEDLATEMTLAITDSQIRSAMTLIGRSRFIQLLQAYNARIDAALSTTAKPEADHE